MVFNEVFRVALRALARNKMRTILTTLGIIIGVGAVICIVGLGQGAGQAVQAQIQGMGANLVMIQAGSVNSGGVRMGAQATKTLTIQDAQAIMQQVPTIAAISPDVGASVQLVNGNRNWYTRTNGVGPAYFQIRNWPIDRGSGFSQRDVDVASEDFFIVASVDQPKSQVLVKHPTEVTTLLNVNAKTVIVDEKGKSIHMSDLRAGDTLWVVSSGQGQDATAIRIRKGSMSIADLHRYYLDYPEIK